MNLWIREIQYVLVFLSLHCFITGFLGAQSLASRRKHEVALTLSTYAPVPSTALERLLRPGLGAGLFYRTNWPDIFFTEVVMAWTYMDSRQTQSLLIAPLFGALGYRLPFESRLDIFAKLGLGSSYVEVRPANVHGWLPLFMSGAELSILAARFLRVGVRLDYFLLYEQHLKKPKEQQHSPPVSGHVDGRFQGRQDFRVYNAHVLRFALLFGFVF